MVWIESPTNPLMKIVNIAEIVGAAKAYRPDIIVAVDNTFMSPYFQVTIFRLCARIQYDSFFVSNSQRSTHCCSACKKTIEYSYKNTQSIAVD